MEVEQPITTLQLGNPVMPTWHVVAQHPVFFSGRGKQARGQPTYR